MGGIDKVGAKPVATPKTADVQQAKPVAAPKPKVAEKPKEADTFKPTPKQAKERAEQMKQVDSLLKGAEVPADVSAKFQERLKKLPPKQFDAEIALMMKHREGPNADRAISTQAKLLEMSQSSPEAKARLTPEVRESLVDAVGTPRNPARFGSNDAIGQAGIMGQQQAEQAAKALVAMPPEQYQATTELLGKAATGSAASPAADAQTEKSLILKAVAARADRLGANLQDDAAVSSGQANATEASRAMKEISDFAGDIRGNAKGGLIESTSPLDLNEGVNSSQVNPNKLNEGRDAEGNNDGLYQRYLQSCGPTVAQMARAEADPVYARALSKDPSLADKDQADMLKKAGADGPRHRESRQLWDQTTETAKKMGLDTDEKFKPVYDLVQGNDQSWWDKAVGEGYLKAIRNQNGGHPTDGEIAKMRSDGKDGKTQMNLDTALNNAASPSTHVQYKSKNVTGSDGPSNEDLAAVDQNLKRGQNVPMRMDVKGEGKTGHFVNITDVRGNEPNRRYLVSDPWSGKTAWVKEGELKNDPGATPHWQKRIFGLDPNRVTDFYVKKD